MWVKITDYLTVDFMYVTAFSVAQRNDNAWLLRLFTMGGVVDTPLMSEKDCKALYNKLMDVLEELDE